MISWFLTLLPLRTVMIIGPCQTVTYMITENIVVRLFIEILYK